MSVIVELRERRVTERVKVKVRAIVTERPEPGAYPGDEALLLPLCGNICNLSKTGLLFETFQPIYPGREVHVTADLSGLTVEFTGYVVRMHHGIDGATAVLAIELYDLDLPVRQAVDALVDANRFRSYLN